MPMDYDDNDFHIHNLHLPAEEEDILPSYDYHHNTLHLRFENQVFLGITGPEDNHWIEQYSRPTTTGITQDLGATDQPGTLLTNMDPILKQHDVQDTFSCFNASLDCEKSHDTQSHEAKVFDGELDSIVLGNEKVDTICDDVNQEAENIAVELCKVSTSKVECEDTCSEQNIDASNACDLTKDSSSNETEYSIKNKETTTDNPIGGHAAVETSTYVDEKPSLLSNVESLDKLPFEVGILVNDESTSLMPTESSNLLMSEESRVCESSAEVSHGGEPSASIPSESLEFNDRMHDDAPATPPVAVEDDITKSVILASPESNASSPSKVSDIHSSIEEPENANGMDAQQATPNGFDGSAGSDPSEMREGNSVNDVDTNLASAYSLAEVLAGSISNTELVASDNTQKGHSGDSSNKIQTPAAKLSFSVQVDDEVRSSEQVGICLDPNVTFNEGKIASLPSDCDDMDTEVVGALDSQKNVESTTSAEDCNCKAQVSEADMTNLAEPGIFISYAYF